MTRKKPKFPKDIPQADWIFQRFEHLTLKDRAKLLFWFMGMHLYLFEKESRKNK